MAMKFNLVFASAAVVGSALMFAAGAQAAIPPGCAASEVAAGKALGAKVAELSKTDSAGALAIAKTVASSKSNCFQIAFGSVLDGTGTASVGAPPAAGSASASPTASTVATGQGSNIANSGLVIAPVVTAVVTPPVITPPTPPTGTGCKATKTCPASAG